MRLPSLVLSAFAFALTTVEAQSSGLTIPTHQGPVVGELVLPTVRQFLGIPYATANRWEAPRLPPNHARALKADHFGDSCPQALNTADLEFLKLAGISDIIVPESDNCQSLNIWAPSTRRKQRTAVMVWIYGGGFQFGTSNSVVYNGQNLVRDQDDVTLVTFNYRLNIFGQPNAPQLVSNTTSQNFGLLDIDAAIQWVHDNIAAFGGDPERITIFGQSAGSVAVDAYTFAHPNDKIVKGAIEQSGNLAIVNGSLSNANLDPTAWNQISNAVGCGSVADAAQLKCMKTVSSKTLEDAVIKSNLGFNLLADDINVFTDTPARATSGTFSHIPLLGGSTQHEGDVFVVGVEETSIGFSPPVITELFADIQTQLGFTCPASKTANDRLQAGVPVWRYQYQGVFPDISTRSDLRAYHAAEIPIVFGTYNASTASAATPAEIALSKYMQSAWATFARDPVHGLLEFGWPAYNPSTASLVQLGGFGNQSGATFAQPGPLDLLCAPQAQLALLQIETQLQGVLLGAASAHT